MIATILCAWDGTQPDLPPVSPGPEATMHLAYTDESGVMRGGWELLAIPFHDRALVRVDTSPEAIAAMREFPERWEEVV